MPSDRIYTRTMADFEQALNDAGTERPESHHNDDQPAGPSHDFPSI